MPESIDETMTAVIQRFQRASEQPPAWSEPSAGTWDAIASSLGFAPGPESAAAAPAPSAEQYGRGDVSRRGLFTGLGALVVGAALGAGGLKIAQVATQPREVPVKRAVLTPLNREDEKLGIAELHPKDVGYSLVVDVPGGADNPGGYVEVWLINVDLKRMISVGVFVAGTAARFNVSDALIEAGYTIVDLSNEGFDDDSRHSSDTIMRGALRA